MPTGGRFDVIAYEEAEGGTPVEGSKVITPEGTVSAIRCANCQYLYLARKVLNFTSSADAQYWATLQVSPTLELWAYNEVSPRLTTALNVDVVGSSAMVEAYFDPRYDGIAEAAGFSTRWSFKFLNIVSDTPPDTVQFYH